MKREKVFANLEIAIIVLLAIVPLFVSFPYRVNIFISWEGAYRMSRGELPFRDFGTSLGGMYWVIPALFFKVFGTQMITLIKAQVFINIISGLAFRSILRSLSVQKEVIFLSVCLYCLSYSFINFWPWYNHSVIVYQFIGLAFVLKGVISERYKLALILSGSVFTCLSFLTKQDAGGMAFAICLTILIYCSIKDKSWWMPVTFFFGFVGFFFIITLPFLSKGFPYWFNYGQLPHTARISIREIISEFFYGSMWIKFYLFMLLLIVLGKIKIWKNWFGNGNELLFLLITLLIIGEAIVFQVTSYTPPDNNIFFHSFAIAFILNSLVYNGLFSLQKNESVFIVLLGILLWWSSIYWKYFQRIMDRAFPASYDYVSKSGENIINRNTYMFLGDTTEIPMSNWEFSNLKSFNKVYMPKPTVEGIDRLMKMDIVNKGNVRKVLNMTELTPLAVEIPYDLEREQEYPLWYHLGVSMFNKQAKMFEKRIVDKEYDLVLFEYIPTLNNFFPFRVRDSLKVHYKMVDSFMAPRRGETKGTIEIYKRK